MSSTPSPRPPCIGIYYFHYSHPLASNTGVTTFFDINEALFPPQFCTKFNIIQSIGVNYILADEAYERQHLQPILAASLTIGMQICIAP